MRITTKELTTLGATLLATAALAGVAQAGSTQSPPLVNTVWDCHPGGTLTFLLPPSPNPRSPVPGFLVSSGQTYVVLEGGPIGGPLTQIGQKTGLAGNTLDCTSSFEGGTEVIIAPASR